MSDGPNLLYNGVKTICSAWAKVLVEAKACEEVFCIKGEDVGGTLRDDELPLLGRQRARRAAAAAPAAHPGRRRPPLRERDPERDGRRAAEAAEADRAGLRARPRSE